MRSGHIFAGCGGGLYADLILGHTPVLALEWDAWRCDVLRQREQDGWFPDLTVVCDDVRTWSAADWEGHVDILHAGVPCPAWSTARRGAGSPPNHWPDVLRSVICIKPRYLFLECVPGFAEEHATARDDLHRVGYGLCDPLILDAAAVGAPHSRARYWALGYSYDESKPMRRIDAEMAELPAADPGMWWEADPRVLRVDDGMADRGKRKDAIGDGQVPLCAAAAYMILGGPTA